MAQKLDRPNKWFYRAMLWSISLPFIANTSGWIMTEIGRQPWTVFGLMQTKDSVSPSVTGGQILFSLIAFTLIYAVLGAVMAYLFVKVIKKGPNEDGAGATIRRIHLVRRVIMLSLNELWFILVAVLFIGFFLFGRF
ncbi:hypothetical protein HMSSN036_72440 [Paenibacillus macerans]|nr:hypothetical protein HMSSN036_72440 [Paenibacillus macerans]